MGRLCSSVSCDAGSSDAFWTPVQYITTRGSKGRMLKVPIELP
jgi:hypothetical protein